MNMLARNENNWGRELKNFNSMMDLFIKEMGLRPAKWFDEALDNHLQVTVDEKTVTAVLPCAGCKGSDFEVEVVGDMLNVTFKHSSCNCGEEGKEEKKEKHFITKERCIREFSESIRIPVPVNGLEATAKYEDGVLSVIIPRVGVEEKKLHTVKVNG
ncbi:MAG: Hsp20/alpha crystallin family protein [Lentisphaeria bacterium]|nr:Hsp20/alpha crystallin family protein [Lentisphaeria bacterium]